MTSSTSADRPVFQAPLTEWRDFKKPTVVVFPKVLTVSAKRTWFERASIKDRVETSSVDAFKIQGDYQDTLLLVTDEGEWSFKFASPVDARGLCNTLRSLLGPLDEVSRSEMRQNEETRLREQAEREKRARLESYASWFWSAAGDCAMLARSAYRIVSVLRTQDWKEAKAAYSAMWPRTRSFETATGAVLLSSLEQVGEACSALDGPAAVKKCASFLGQLATATLEITRAADKSIDEAMRDLIRPNWYHLRFFLLFVCLSREARLAAEVGDWAAAEASLSTLTTLSGVLQSALLAPVADQVMMLVDAAARRDLAALQGASQSLDQHVDDYIKAHPRAEVV